MGNRQYIHPEYSCKCEEAKRQREESDRQKAIEKWNKTNKISLSESIDKLEMVFIDGEDKYLPPDELEEWIDDKRFDYPDWQPGFIYGTRKIQLTLDAADIISDHCENQELHEEAYDQISMKALNELQEFMNQWSKSNVAGTTTYFPDFSVGILLKTDI